MQSLIAWNFVPMSHLGLGLVMQPGGHRCPTESLLAPAARPSLKFPSAIRIAAASVRQGGGG